MPGSSIPIGKLFGISIKLHFSWFFVFALVTWFLTTQYFPDFYPDWSLATSITIGVITSLLFFASVLAHELMHSVVAQRSGIPVKSITLFIFGGVSQISKEPDEPKIELRIALAGPLTSIVLGGIFWAIWLTASWLTLPSAFEGIIAVAFWLGWINLLLGFFNLIPGFPLDGGRVLRSLLWWRTGNLRRATKIASNIGRGVGILFISGGVGLIIFTGFWINGIWIAFIGWFLQNAAAGSYQQLAIQEMLKDHTASEIIDRNCLLLPPDTTIEKLVNEHILPTGQHCFIVAEDGHPRGFVSLQNIKTVPHKLWPSKLVREVMTPLDKLSWVRPDENLAQVMNTLSQHDLSQLPVVEDGNIVGMISRDNLLAFINARDKLGI